MAMRSERRGVRQDNVLVVVQPPPPPPPPPPRPNVVSAEAELRIDQVQDLAEAPGELQAVAMPNKLILHLHIEMHAEGQAPSQESIAKANQVLNETFGSDILKLK